MTSSVSPHLHTPQEEREPCAACVARELQRVGDEDAALLVLNKSPLAETLYVNSLGQIGCSAHP
jgi:hypothetical protein